MENFKEKLNYVWQRAREPVTLTRYDVGLIWASFGIIWLELAFKQSSLRASGYSGYLRPGYYIAVMQYGCAPFPHQFKGT